MPSPKDNVYASSARAHIEAAAANKARKSLELQQAKAFAALIQDKNLRETILVEIRQAG